MAYRSTEGALTATSDAVRTQLIPSSRLVLLLHANRSFSISKKRMLFLIVFPSAFLPLAFNNISPSCQFPYHFVAAAG